MTSLSPGPFIPRDYDLYGLMGSGRGKVKLFEPRGLPKGSNFDVRWGVGNSNPQANDYRDQSWLTVDELKQVAVRYVSEPAFRNPDRGYVPRLGPEFAATIGAVEALERWCKETGEGEAILVYAFG